MPKTMLTILGSVLLAAATVHFAAATEHKGRKVVRAPAPVGETFGNANAAWPSPVMQPDGPRYYGGYSAPAGR